MAPLVGLDSVGSSFVEETVDGDGSVLYQNDQDHEWMYRDE